MRVTARDPAGASTSAVFSLTVLDGTVINGTNGNDTITGTVNGDRINGLDGNDTINGSTGADFIDGGNGNDTLILGNSGNILNVAGVETLTGGTGNDSIGTNLSTLTNLVATTVFSGGAGTDTLKLSGAGNTFDFTLLSSERIENIEAIAAVPGVDGVFVGPGDLGLRLRVAGASVHAFDPLLSSVDIEATGASPWSWGSSLDAEAIVKKSLDIAADICVYTNRNVTIESLKA